jgi:TolA-binding protein
VFDSVGNAFSRLYTNSVSYFNAYYNAKRIFDEAETTVLNNALASRGKLAPNAPQPPLPAQLRDRFNSVIDKCSSILSFYPNSALADDAIFLIGKSYFYQQEYLKAERKFSELVVQYPTSDLLLESQLWFARTLEKLGRDEDAITATTQVAATAEEERERRIAGDAYFLLGTLYERQTNPQRALECYAKAAELSNNGIVRASAYNKKGDIHLAANEYEKAGAAFAKVSSATSDVYLNYYSRVKAAQSFSAMKRYDTAFYMLNEMLQDFRYNEYHPHVRLEYAHVLAASGRLFEAEEVYRYLDTTFARQDAGGKAAYALAELAEHKRGDYRLARQYYGRATSSSIVDLAAQARKREAAFARYATLQQELVRIDSLMVLSDSVRAVQDLEEHGEEEIDSLSVGHVDVERALVTAIKPKPEEPPTDTLTVREEVEEEPAPEKALDESEVPPETLVAIDSSGVHETETIVVKPKFIPLDADSMLTIKARVAYDLGDVFYSDLEKPDSSFYWFRHFFELKVDSTRAPRALFILAELSRTHPEKRFADPGDLYQKLIQEYPRSSYAEEARRILGIPVVRQSADDAERSYAEAESLLWLGRYEEAIAHLHEIAEDQQGSLIAARSEYAIGWIYEYRLDEPDSARSYYQRVSEQYKTSPYAAALKNKVLSKADSTVSDSPGVPLPERHENRRPPANEESIQPPPRPSRSPSPTDTLSRRRPRND